MKLGTLIAIGKEVRAAYEYRDPEQFCRELGVISLMFPLGIAKRSLKGFIVICRGNVAITVNSDLSPEMARVIFYHEIAHFLLHIRTGLLESVNDCDVFDATSQAEYEANLLAAELQLEDRETLKLLKETGDFYKTAECLECPPQLLDFKLRLLREKGYRLPEAPISASSGYLYHFSEGARREEQKNESFKR